MLSRRVATRPVTDILYCVTHKQGAIPSSTRSCRPDIRIAELVGGCISMVARTLRYDSPRAQFGKQAINRLGRRFASTMQCKFWRFWRFISGTDTGKVCELLSPHLAVQPLRIALLASFERSINVDFEKLSGLKPSTRFLPISTKGRYERDDDDETRIHHHPRNFSYASHVFDPIRVRKSKACAKSEPYFVAIENIRMSPERMKPVLQ